MEQFDIKIERPKPDPIDEIIRLLKKILDCCLCCVTCGCYPGNSSSRRSSTFNGDSEFSSVLMDNERQAVQNLLLYLEDGKFNYINNTIPLGWEEDILTTRPPIHMW